MTIEGALGALNAADIVFAVCVVLALVLMLIGLVGVIRIARPLQRRLDEYQDLPVLRALAVAQAQVETTAARFSEFNTLIARVNAALAEIQSGLAILRACAVSVVTLVTSVGGVATGLLRAVGLGAKALQTRGS